LASWGDARRRLRSLPAPARRRYHHAAGRALFQMLGVFAEFERGIIRERVNAGLARAKENGIKLGRRKVRPAVEDRILSLRKTGMGMLKIGRTVGVGTSVVQRVVAASPAG
jgi:DNA invertase Pin-like site-specific DNA recombinase